MNRGRSLSAGRSSTMVAARDQQDLTFEVLGSRPGTAGSKLMGGSGRDSKLSARGVSNAKPQVYLMDSNHTGGPYMEHVLKVNSLAKKAAAGGRSSNRELPSSVVEAGKKLERLLMEADSAGPRASATSLGRSSSGGGRRPVSAPTGSGLVLGGTTASTTGSSKAAAGDSPAAAAAAAGNAGRPHSASVLYSKSMTGGSGPSPAAAASALIAGASKSGSGFGKNRPSSPFSRSNTVRTAFGSGASMNSRASANLAASIESHDATLNNMYDHLSATAAKLSAAGIAMGSGAGAGGPQQTGTTAGLASSPSLTSAALAHGTAAGSAAHTLRRSLSAGASLSAAFSTPAATATAGASSSGTATATPAASSSSRSGLGGTSLGLTANPTPSALLRPGTPALVSQPGPLTAAQRNAAAAAASAPAASAPSLRPRSGKMAGTSQQPQASASSGTPSPSPPPEPKCLVSQFHGHRARSRSADGSPPVPADVKGTGSPSSVSASTPLRAQQQQQQVDDTSLTPDSARSKLALSAGKPARGSSAAAAGGSDTDVGSSTAGSQQPGSPIKHNLTLDMSKIRSPFDQGQVVTLSGAASPTAAQPPATARDQRASRLEAATTAATSVGGRKTGAGGTIKRASKPEAGTSHPASLTQLPKGPSNYVVPPLPHPSTQVMANLVQDVSELAAMFGLDDVFVSSLPLRSSFN